MPKNIVIIRKDGSLVVDAYGYKGRMCLKELENLLKLLREKYGVNVNIEYQELKPEEVEETTTEYVTT